MAPKWTPTETSPLLGESHGNGTACNRVVVDHDAESGEPRQSVEEQGKEPFLDAKNQLKYIVPAISIGV